VTCEKHENWHAVCAKCAHQELLDAQEGFADYKYRTEQLEARLQIDPGGSDRIDELEDVVMHFHAALLTVAERQRDACRAYLLQCAREIVSDGGDAHLADALFRAAVRVDYAPLVAPEEDK
jgi:hypothetical protein